MLGAQFWSSAGLMLLASWLCVHCVPISSDPPEGNPDLQQNTQLPYRRYLMEVEQVLKQDPHFSAKLQNSTIDDLMHGRLSGELESVHHSIRSKLDELKREELQRLRSLLKAKHAMAEQKGLAVDRQAVLRHFEHLNHINPDKFDAADLDRLIAGVNRHMEQLDESRRAEFKRDRMMREHERREHLRGLGEGQRRGEELRPEPPTHAKINHPGSEDQLKEVWEEADGLDPSDFNPKTFFKLHDYNGDGFLDETELEALFNVELEKAYDNSEDAAALKEEERMRMRDHVMTEVDTNKDRLVSLDEFLESVKRDEFSENEEWETIDQNPGFTEEELRAFELQQEGGGAPAGRNEKL